MPMCDPPHPDETVFVLCYETFELSTADATVHLKMEEE